MPMSTSSPEARIRMLQMMKSQSAGGGNEAPVPMPPPHQVSVPSAGDYAAGLDSGPGPSRDMPTQAELASAGQTVPTWTDPFSGEIHYSRPKVAGSFVDMQSGQRMPRLAR